MLYIHICGFDNPDKCTNRGNRALATTIMEISNANVPTKTRLARQRHTSEKSAALYPRNNPVAEH